MKKTIDASLGGMMFIVLLMVAVLFGMGCSAREKSHQHTTPPVTYKKPLRCKVVGKASTSNAAVLVERNCLRNGLTTVNVVVLNTKDEGKSAAKDSVTMIEKILGYKPVLKVLFYGKAKGLPFFMMVVIER